MKKYPVPQINMLSQRNSLMGTCWFLELGKKEYKIFNLSDFDNYLVDIFHEAFLNPSVFSMIDKIAQDLNYPKTSLFDKMALVDKNPPLENHVYVLFYAFLNADLNEIDTNKIKWFYKMLENSHIDLFQRRDNNNFFNEKILRLKEEFIDFIINKIDKLLDKTSLKTLEGIPFNHFLKLVFLKENSDAIQIVKEKYLKNIEIQEIYFEEDLKKLVKNKEQIQNFFLILKDLKKLPNPYSLYMFFLNDKDYTLFDLPKKLIEDIMPQNSDDADTLCTSLFYETEFDNMSKNIKFVLENGLIQDPAIWEKSSLSLNYWNFESSPMKNNNQNSFEKQQIQNHWIENVARNLAEINFIFLNKKNTENDLLIKEIVNKSFREIVEAIFNGQVPKEKIDAKFQNYMEKFLFEKQVGIEHEISSIQSKKHKML